MFCFTRFNFIHSLHLFKVMLGSIKENIYVLSREEEKKSERKN